MDDMNVLKQQINLTLFQDLMAFIADTAKADGSQVLAARERCMIPFSTRDDGTFQTKYGFMYLGELLERYEERFGMALPDLRAIALALAYTRDLTPDDMFVGTQRVDFLKKIQKTAAGDTYLTGALYLLHEGRSGAEEYETALRQARYKKTEDILFIMSLFPDTEENFLCFKPSLLRLLGKERSIPVFGNMRLFVWLISRIRPLVKKIRTKDMALFRALCALPASFVKQGSKHYELLSEAGCTPLEIAYANMRAVWITPATDRLSWNSVVTEKVLVSLLQEVFRTETPLAPDVYEQLAEWIKKYETFPIKCDGHYKLLDALNHSEKIKSPETFHWFTAHAPLSHGAFQGFDIMDPHWNGLAAAMKYEDYIALFETFLHDGLSTEDIKARLSRFDLLTGRDYMKYGEVRLHWFSFRLLVQKDVIDLWTAFQDCVDADGKPVKPQMLDHIGDELRGMGTIQAFRFYERFLPRYGFRGLETYFHNESLFLDSVASCVSYRYRNDSGSQVELTLEQEYLDDDMRRLLLYWLSEYFWESDPIYYLPLVAKILDTKAVASLFSFEEQRALFDLVMADPSFLKSSAANLKERYLTAEEKEAERAEQAARKLEHERQERLALEKEVQDQVAQTIDGSMTSLLKLAVKYKFDSQRREFATAAVYDHLLRIESGQAMDKREYACLLKLCAWFLEKNRMSFAEVQNLIIKIKEAPHYGSADTADCAG